MIADWNWRGIFAEGISTRWDLNRRLVVSLTQEILLSLKRDGNFIRRLFSKN